MDAIYKYVIKYKILLKLNDGLRFIKELFNLDEHRAKEIVNSKGVIEVLYQGSAVWIDQVKDNNMALVHYISNNKKDEVPVYKLIES